MDELPIIELFCLVDDFCCRFQQMCSEERIILISLESCNLGNAKALGFQRSKIGPYTHMDLFLIVEA